MDLEAAGDFPWEAVEEPRFPQEGVVEELQRLRQVEGEFDQALEGAAVAELQRQRRVEREFEQALEGAAVGELQQLQREVVECLLPHHASGGCRQVAAVEVGPLP